MTPILATSLRTMTEGARRGFLRELAEHVYYERNSAHKPFTDAAHATAADAASICCPDPAGGFDRLVAAVRELAQFHGDPVGYAAERDLRCDTAMERLGDTLDAAVTVALDRLMGGAE